MFELLRFYKNIFFINEVFALFARPSRCIYRPFRLKCCFYSFIVLFISFNPKCFNSLHIIFPSSYIEFVAGTVLICIYISPWKYYVILCVRREWRFYCFEFPASKQTIPQLFDFQPSLCKCRKPDHRSYWRVPIVDLEIA